MSAQSDDRPHLHVVEPARTPIETLALRLVELLELRHRENNGGDFAAIGVHELCVGIKTLSVKGP